MFELHLLQISPRQCLKELLKGLSKLSLWFRVAEDPTGLWKFWLSALSIREMLSKAFKLFLFQQLSTFPHLFTHLILQNVHLAILLSTFIFIPFLLNQDQRISNQVTVYIQKASRVFLLIQDWIQTYLMKILHKHIQTLQVRLLLIDSSKHQSVARSIYLLNSMNTKVSSKTLKLGGVS